MQPNAARILDIFEQINAIPRCSGREEEICRWLSDWAQKRGLEYRTDNAGNLVIVVPPTAGCENAPVLVLQGHMDMVCEKTPASTHDFKVDPIRHRIDGQWLDAVDTSLGADNGIAIALALAVVESASLKHPPLELLFTVDEETGLTGAQAITPDFIQGRILLNLDSESDGVFTIGCAGGVDTRLVLTPALESLPINADLACIAVSGLKGGHSGVDIHKQRANANKILARVLLAAGKAAPFGLLSLKGGSAHNAIARDAEAKVACASPESMAALVAAVAECRQTVKAELALSEPSAEIVVQHSGVEGGRGQVFSAADTRRIVDLLLALPSGVAEMSDKIEGLVETSCNLATIDCQSGHVEIVTSQRSATASKLEAITASIEAVAALAQAQTTREHGYPPWPPDLESPLLDRCLSTYRHTFGQEPATRAIHAGLECAVIGKTCSGMDMISFGPTIENPHSPDERLHIPSVENVWRFLSALLASYGH